MRKSSNWARSWMNSASLFYLRGIVFWVLVAIGVGFFASTMFANPAHSQEIGETYHVNASCLTEEDTIKLSNSVIKYNDEGWRNIIDDPEVRCISHVMTEAKLVEKLWSITRQDGQQYQFWRVEDRNGMSVYTWTYTKPKEGI